MGTQYQSHSGAVNTSTSPKVQYGYASGNANSIRPTTMTYPDGRVLTYGYGSSGGTNDAASRIESLIDDDGSSTHLANYSYLGLGTFVEVDYTEPDVRYTLVGTAGGNDPDTGDIYRGLDRFGRIKDSYWYNYGTSSDADRIKYGYDRSGNRLWRENTVATSLSKYFDELYGYDRVDRLQDMERGRLAALKDSISSLQFAQDWSLDATGNWRHFREDDNGAGWDLDQVRTANKVNEITDISDSVGPSWVTPVYSRAGNMTTIPKPADPTTSFAATYDAWNRLVGISSGGTTVAGYEYDGAKRRIIRKSYTSGTLTDTRHAYFTEPSKWQVIEERVDSSSSAERQFVWGLRYIDDLVLRDRDTDGNGTLDERLYGMQDANWNVTGLVSTSGTVQERYAYSAYGKPMFLDASFGSRSSSSYAWERLFAAYVWDADVQWYAVRHRVYVVGLGWVQRDPVGYSHGINLLEYASSNPIRSVDPMGLAWIDTVLHYAQQLLWIGTVGCHNWCWPFPPNPGFTICVSLCVRVDAYRCCEGRKVKSCISVDVTLSGGVYFTGSRSPIPGSSPPPGNFIKPINFRKFPKWPPAKWFNVPIRHGLRLGCPPEGLQGQLCAVASAGIGPWAFGGRVCIGIPSGKIWGQIGMGVGQGTGVAIEGGIIGTSCK